VELRERALVMLRDSPWRSWAAPELVVSCGGGGGGIE